ncbi:DUF885 domain-containing protein [Sorangium sp. So ce327]|uniref:DUF885 domain-containing protein n=1 Tax=Sorangium sp. So ce327 TaxID=3133301 RepID=UPI003F5D87BC
MIGQAAPEQVGYLGVEGFEEAVIDVAVSSDERDVRALQAVASRFADGRKEEPDADARTDLLILEDAARRMAERTRLSTRVMVRVTDVGQTIYQGLAPLLGAEAPTGHRAIGERRARRYLGDGAVPLVDAAIARIREDVSARKLPPTRPEVQQLLVNIPSLRDAIVALAGEARLPQAEALGAALDRWRRFVETELLPTARDDFRLPPELYAMNLRDAGVDDAPAALAARARAAYDETMTAWRALAGEIAAERRLADSDPARVLAALKRDQRTGTDLQALFGRRIAEIEQVIRREHLMTLPGRPLLFRAATPAEIALNPSPTIDTQGFLKGERDIAVLMPGAPAPGAPPYDDFTYEAAVWPLLVHEGRPGHEMQFTTAIARGMSPARTLFAFNAANLEGWALYCEDLMRPFMPKESRFVALHYLLVRQARAFLDPWLQSGRVSVGEARDVLHAQLGTSEALTDAEIQRYTFRSPGQATAYFFGLEKFRQLRSEVERALGSRFDQARFHDAILHQGFAPLPIVAEGVKRELNAAP